MDTVRARAWYTDLLDILAFTSVVLACVESLETSFVEEDEILRVAVALALLLARRLERSGAIGTNVRDVS